MDNFGRPAEPDWAKFERGESGYVYDIYKQYVLMSNNPLMRGKAMVPAIETKYKGILFRSRTEARWAVFFDAAGIHYEYEKEGFPLPAGCYLPDFWLPELASWFEVKGAEPTAAEVEKCRDLARLTEAKRVMLAVGAPRPKDQIILIGEDSSPEGDDSLVSSAYPIHPRYYFADDRRNEGEFWLVSSDETCFSIGPVFGPDHWKYPVIGKATGAGYEAARTARFW